MSTIAGQALFDSGPHRFAPRKVGRLWAPPLRLDSLQDRVVVFSTILELHIVQTGRLAATSEAALWALVDVIKARCESALTGTLVDSAGRAWTNMTLLTFTPGDRVDRGRVFSLEYSADYVRLL